MFSLWKCVSLKFDWQFFLCRAIPTENYQIYGLIFPATSFMTSVGNFQSDIYLQTQKKTFLSHIEFYNCLPRNKTIAIPSPTIVSVEYFSHYNEGNFFHNDTIKIPRLLLLFEQTSNLLIFLIPSLFIGKYLFARF